MSCLKAPDSVKKRFAHDCYVCINSVLRTYFSVNLDIILGPGILSFIERLSFLWRLKCTSIIEKGPQSVSFIERWFFLS